MVEIKGFRDVEVIGRGGFSTVYRAHQTAQSRDVAVKVLDVGLVDEAQKTRFERECAAMGRLGSHPNVMTVYESGYTNDDKPYIAMELCDGGSLADRVAELGRLPLAESLHSMIRIAGALETAHRSGITHRDVKPENMMITTYGEVVLSDFGISALDPVRSGTATGSSFTLMHVAPEVLEGKAAQASADIYSLGSSLFRLLTGAAPHADSTTPIAVAVSRIMNDPVSEVADVPKSLNKALAKAMAKSPSSRFASCLAFAEALQEVQRELGLPVTDCVVGSGTTPARTPTEQVESVSSSSAPTTQRASTTAPRLPKVEAPVLPTNPLWKKILSGAAVVAVLVGGGVFAFTQMSGKDSGTSSDTSTPGATTTSVSMETSTLAVQTFPPVAASSGSAATTAAPAATPAPAATTAAPVATTVAPAATTTFPLFTPLPSFTPIPTTFPLLNPGVISAILCGSFGECAQDLFDAWKSNSKTSANLYGETAAVNSLFAISYASTAGTWNATVSKLNDYTYEVKQWLPISPKRIRFFFVAGQSGYKVQSVAVS